MRLEWAATETAIELERVRALVGIANAGLGEQMDKVVMMVAFLVSSVASMNLLIFVSTGEDLGRKRKESLSRQVYDSLCRAVRRGDVGDRRRQGRHRLLVSNSRKLCWKMLTAEFRLRIVGRNLLYYSHSVRGGGGGSGKSTASATAPRASAARGARGARTAAPASRARRGRPEFRESRDRTDFRDWRDRRGTPALRASRERSGPPAIRARGSSLFPRWSPTVLGKCGLI